jgi:hypothetical protein
MVNFISHHILDLTIALICVVLGCLLARPLKRLARGKRGSNAD